MTSGETSRAVPAKQGPARGALIRSVALPTEHGGWSFVLEPIALGLAVAGSLAGIVLGVGVLATFLVHQPTKTAIKDRLAGRRAFRTVWAERFAVAYAAIAAIALGLAVWRAGWHVLAMPLAGAPFAAAQLVWDARNKSRALGAELCGALALGSVGSAIAMAGGWPAATASGLWLVLAARSLPSILYVRERLKLERRKPVGRFRVFAAHAAALLATAAAAAAGFVPWLATAAMALLLVRGVHGLSSTRLGSSPAAVGAQEVALGLATVAIVAIGYIA